MKKWVLFILENSLLFLLLVAAVFILSIFFVKNLNVEAFPDPAPPIVEIISLFEGRSSEEVERQVTINLEVALAGMEGLQRLNSISIYGLSDIKCKFDYGVSYKQAKQEVLNRLANASVPDGVQPQIVPNPMGEVMRYQVAGDANLLELRSIQDWTVARYLKTAIGVDDVPSEGGYIKTYNIVVFPEQLVKFGLTLPQVIDAMSRSNLNVGGRVIQMGDQYYMVRGRGLITSMEDIENALVAMKGGKPILVKNLAKVSIGNVPRTGIVALNREDDIVMGTVTLRKDAKSIPSLRSIHAKIKDLNDRILPKGIKVIPYYDRWNLIATVVKKVIETASVGVVLVTLTLYVFLGNFRAAVLTASMIPISLLITLAIMALRGESANLLSIGAIDFGIIADIPLILMEAYFRITRKYGPGARATVAAAEEVGKPMIFSVVIILLAFVPIFMMRGAEGQIFAPMAKTYLYAIFFTALLTFTYLVAGKQLFLKHAHDKEYHFFVTLRDRYLAMVKNLLGRSKTVLVIASVVVVFGLIAGFRSIGSQFLPKMDEGNIYIRVVFPYSISLEKTYENAKRIKAFLVGLPETRTVDFKMGRPEDGTDPNGPFNSEYTVLPKPYDQWREGLTKEQLEDFIREKLKGMFPNADINISQYIQDNLEEIMSGVKGENSLKIFGEDLVELDRVAKEMKKILENTPGIKDVGVLRELGQPNLLIDVDRANAAMLGLTVQDVLDTVSAALGGKEVSRIIEGEKNFSLVVSFPMEYRKSPEKIANIPIVLINGGVVPLSRLAHIHYGTGASFIYREGFRRYIPTKFSVTSKDLGGTVERAQVEAAKIPLQKGYFMEWSGMFNEMKESFKRFYISVPLSLFLILATLYMLYRSVKNVLIVMVGPVFAVFAGLISLLITGESLNVSSMVGFISLIGVSVLNSSILVSYYIQISLEGMQNSEAILEAIKSRFRPLLIGGFVAALGLLPAALARGVGSQIQKPLAIVVVGGMLIGTALDLVIKPLLLKYVDISE